MGRFRVVFILLRSTYKYQNDIGLIENDHREERKSINIRHMSFRRNQIVGVHLS